MNSTRALSLALCALGGLAITSCQRAGAPESASPPETNAELTGCEEDASTTCADGHGVCVGSSCMVSKINVQPGGMVTIPGRASIMLPPDLVVAANGVPIPWNQLGLQILHTKTPVGIDDSSGTVVEVNALNQGIP